MTPLSTYNNKPMKLVKRHCTIAANDVKATFYNCFYMCEITGEVKTTPEQDRENTLAIEQAYKTIVQSKRE